MVNTKPFLITAALTLVVNAESDSFGCQDVLQLAQKCTTDGCNSQYTMGNTDYYGNVYDVTGDLEKDYGNGLLFTLEELKAVLAEQTTYSGGYCGNNRYYRVNRATGNIVEPTVENLVIRDVSIGGLEAVVETANNNTQVQVWVTNGDLAINSTGSSELVSLEPALLASSEGNQLAKRDLTTFFAGISTAVGAVGLIPAIGSFIAALIGIDDSNSENNVESAGNCYFKLDNEARWGGSTCDADMKMASIMALEKHEICPNIASCFYVRKGPAGGSTDDRATNTFGTDYNGVAGLSCDSYQLQETYTFNPGSCS